MKKLGFGCMRLPLVPGTEDQVDLDQFQIMVDRYLAEGFCYFDTARVYLNGASETALRQVLVRRYPRDRFVLTDKLSGSCYAREEDIRPLFQAQLEACGVEYFDYYLIHALSSQVYPKVEQCRAFDHLRQFQREGRVRHIGISFHDRPELLEQVLTRHPEIEVVQIQFNYADCHSPTIQSRRVYEVCRRFHKPVLVMEPVKGGVLADLSPQAAQVFASLEGGSAASYAIRYAASFEGVMMVLSGMSTLEQMEDNLSYMKHFQPLTDRELAAVEQVRALLQAEDLVPCTACRYCVPGCPRHIQIPDLFASLNAARRRRDWPVDFYYSLSVQGHGKASDCVQCRRCEAICPQHLPITDLLRQVSQTFEPA